MKYLVILLTVLLGACTCYHDTPTEYVPSSHVYVVGTSRYYYPSGHPYHYRPAPPPPHKPGPPPPRPKNNNGRGPLNPRR